MVAMRLGVVRGKRHRRGFAAGVGFFVGAIVVAGTLALMQSSLWWWVQEALGDVLFILGGGMGTFFALHYYDLRRAARRVGETAAAEQEIRADGQRHG